MTTHRHFDDLAAQARRRLLIGPKEQVTTPMAIGVAAIRACNAASLARPALPWRTGTDLALN